MARGNDWVKTKHHEFLEQAENILTYIVAPENKERMNFGDKSKVGEWLLFPLQAFSKFKEIYKRWSDEPERSRALQYELEQAEKHLKMLMRQLYVSFLKASPFVMNEDLAHMGLPERHEGPKRLKPVADTAPFCRTSTPGAGRIEWHFYSVKNGVKQAKPAGQQGVEIRWEMTSVPVIDQENLRHSDFCTRSPFVLDFSGSERGKSIYYAMRWQNTRGEKGPWSPVEVVFIP